MINICLCVKLHIPAIQAKYRFSDVHANHAYFNESQMEEHVRSVYLKNLLPFFKAIRNIHFETDKKFKIGFSISGITLMLFEKYVPEALEQIRLLEKTNCVEILSELWSHSIVAYFDMKTLRKQIDMHDKAVQSVIGKTPDIFIVHSPAYLHHFAHEVSALGKKAIFTNLNMIQNKEYKKLLAGNNHDGEIAPMLPINYKISNMLQKIDLEPFLKASTILSRRMISRFKKSVPQNIPAILIYDPTFINGMFPLSRVLSWKTVIFELIKDPEIAFSSPSEAVSYVKPSVKSQRFDNKFSYFSKLNDKWIKNIYQKDIFEKQLRVNMLMQTDNRSNLEEQWNMLQDMDHLFYMNSIFNNSSSMKNHFNPFQRNKEAFINYSNVLHDILNSLEDENF